MATQAATVIANTRRPFSLYCSGAPLASRTYPVTRRAGSSAWSTRMPPAMTTGQAKASDTRETLAARPPGGGHFRPGGRSGMPGVGVLVLVVRARATVGPAAVVVVLVVSTGGDADAVIALEAVRAGQGGESPGIRVVVVRSPV